MKQIINFIDADVDGCGTDVETMIQIEGDQALTNGAIKRIKDAIERYKKENYGEYSPYDGKRSIGGTLVDLPIFLDN